MKIVEQNNFYLRLVKGPGELGDLVESEGPARVRESLGKNEKRRAGDGAARRGRDDVRKQ